MAALSMDPGEVSVATAAARAAAIRQARRRETLTMLAVRLGSLAVVLAAWQLYGTHVNQILFTYPTAVAAAFAQDVANGTLLHAASSSLLNLFIGMAAAMVGGILAGVAMARFKWLDWAVGLYSSALYATPMVALVPLLVLWFGFGSAAKIFVVGSFVFFPMLINTYAGVKNVDRSLLEVARAFRCSEGQMWWHVVIPGAVPFIMAGLNQAVGRALVGVVIAEFYTSLTGLGYMIEQAANTYQTAQMFVPIVVLMVLGVLLMALVRLLQARISPWFEGD